ncbi:hypothetical protein MMC34_008046 [Xylographa carneopallida]|nr:hypothetical protein [Xylographa carneopallida]
MARGLFTTTLSADVDAINLRRALSRLEHKVLSVNADPRLVWSTYERSKTAAVCGKLLAPYGGTNQLTGEQNVEHARDLLLRLEHSIPTIKIQSHKQAAQDERVRQRCLIKCLNDRLYNLAQEDDGTFPFDPTNDEDILEEKALPAGPTAPASSTPLTLTLDRWNASSVPHGRITSTLRSRLLPSAPSVSEITARSPSSNPTTREAPTPVAPTILESDSSTQAQLTSSLVQLAAALKQSSLTLSASLAEDNIILSTTVSALDKNTDGMSAASKRMGMLRSMSEGRWWWGRMLLYGMIGVLWLVALIIVFLMPKLRW